MGGSVVVVDVAVVVGGVVVDVAVVVGGVVVMGGSVVVVGGSVVVVGGSVVVSEPPPQEASRAKQMSIEIFFIIMSIEIFFIIKDHFFVLYIQLKNEANKWKSHSEEQVQILKVNPASALRQRSKSYWSNHCINRSCLWVLIPLRGGQIQCHIRLSFWIGKKRIQNS